MISTSPVLMRPKRYFSLLFPTALLLLLAWVALGGSEVVECVVYAVIVGGGCGGVVWR